MHHRHFRTLSARQVVSHCLTSINSGLFWAAMTVLVVMLYSPASSNAADKSTPIGVVELFTSQGCSSCPPADENLALMLASEPDMLALEFHVDYWDDLVWGSDGVWKDPFSKPEYTLRQLQYNQVKLKGRTGVYTPQSVINGQYSLVGVNIADTRQVLDTTVPTEVSVTINAADDQLLVNVENPNGLSANIYLARFLKKTSTEIKGGENNGKQLHNVSVVTDYDSLGQLDGKSQHSFTVAANGDSNIGCAVVVQSGTLGPILGAARCP